MAMSYTSQQMREETIRTTKIRRGFDFGIRNLSQIPYRRIAITAIAI